MQCRAWPLVEVFENGYICFRVATDTEAGNQFVRVTKNLGIVVVLR